MATISKALFRGAATTTVGTTLYTVPSGYSAVVTNILVTNTAGSAGTFTLALNGTALATTVAIAANSIALFDIKQVLVATNTITGGASATTINFHISGVEIS
jgi:hypothetical protein